MEGVGKVQPKDQALELEENNQQSIDVCLSIQKQLSETNTDQHSQQNAKQSDNKQQKCQGQVLQTDKGRFDHSQQSVSLAADAQIQYRIETIFVMDDEPFKPQRIAVTGLQPLIQSDPTKRNLQSDSISVIQAPTDETQIELSDPNKIPAEIPNLSALKPGEPSSASKIKERKNSSQLPACGTFAKGLRSKAQRKISFDQAFVEDTTIQRQEGDAAKNLLAEFEKDETLEPGTTLSYDSKFKVSQKHNSSAIQPDASPKTVAESHFPESKGKQPAYEERESFQKRTDWRQVDQIQRQISKPNVRNQDKKQPNVEDSTAQSTVATISLQNMRDQQQKVSKNAEESSKELAAKNEDNAKKEEHIRQAESLRHTSLLDKFTAEDFFEGQPQLKVRFTEVVRKFNHELMKSTCQVMKGCKSWKAKKISSSVFELLNEILKHTQGGKATKIATCDKMQQENDAIQLKKKESHSSSNKNKIVSQKSQDEFTSSACEDSSKVRVVKQITTSVSTLKRILNYCFQMNNYQKPDCLKDFLVASLLMQSKINVIILLAGTSGTGKSTLASLLGTRLGISTVLSTDSVRHVMRNFLQEKANPTLFCSTYEAGNTVSKEDRQNASESWITLKGYKQQCALVTKELAKVIDSFYQRNESLVVEGVHLTPSFLKEMMTKYSTCIPFVLYIKNKNKHGERFAVRAKHMTIDPRFNKYINNIQHIRTIQEYLLKKSEEVLIPRIENHNVDRSVSLIQTTIMRSLHRIQEGHAIYDTQQKRATGIHKVFQSIHKNQLSSKQAQGLIHQKVDRFKMVESFLKSANHKADFDPTFERKLTQHRLSASFEALPVNIWECGEFVEESKDNKKKKMQQMDGDDKRSQSIMNILPQITTAPDSTKLDTGVASGSNSQVYYKLSKAEKKQIKRDLMEFAKKSQGLNKESQLRKNLIETEEDLEAKICEGSQASSILNDHKKKKEKLGQAQQIGKTEGQNEKPSAEVNPIANNIVIIEEEKSLTSAQNKVIEDQQMLKSVESVKIVSEQPGEEIPLQDESQKKLLEKRLMSDKQKENEMILLKEAQRKAEKQIQKEESQQMTEELKETMQKPKRNKSQEPAGAQDQDKSEEHSFNSQGSLEVMADDEDDQDRLREVHEFDRELNFSLLPKQKTSFTKEKPNQTNFNKTKLLEKHKQQFQNIQNVNLLDFSEKLKPEKEPQVLPKKAKFDYKLDSQQKGSADDLIRKVAQQQATTSSKETQKSGFVPRPEVGQRVSRKKEVVSDTSEGKQVRPSKRLKPKVEKADSLLRQSSAQQPKEEKDDEQSKVSLTPMQSQQSRKLQLYKHKSSKPPTNQSNTTTLASKQTIHASAINANTSDSKQHEEEKKKESRSGRRHLRQDVDKRSMTIGSTHIYSNRGDAHSSQGDHQQLAASGSEQDAFSAQGEKQTSVGKRPAKQLAQTSNDDGQSGFGDTNKTIEEEDSEYSQTIGSLVSYTINYMEKNTIRGGGGHSSQHDRDRINEVEHSDSDSDKDHSLMAEKEDSHSDIDTIEEEVDLSSEGSDHEEQQEEQQNQNKVAAATTQKDQEVKDQQEPEAAAGASTTQVLDSQESRDTVNATKLKAITNHKNSQSQQDDDQSNRQQKRRSGEAAAQSDQNRVAGQALPRASI